MKCWFPSRSFRRIIGVSVVIIAVVYFCGPCLLRSAGEWLNVGRPLATPVRFGYVLGGGADVRPVTAAGLFRAGLVQELLVPDPPFERSGRCNSLSESEIVQSVLLQEGVPASNITVLKGNPSSTEEEMVLLAHFLRTHDQSEVALVTNDYHSRRVARLFTNQLKLRGMEKKCEMHVVSVPTDDYSAKNWWCTEDGLLNYGLEFAKTLRDFLKSATGMCK